MPNYKKTPPNRGCFFLFTCYEVSYTVIIMNNLSSDASSWDYFLLFAAYGILILLYIVILKALMNCIEHMMSKNHHSQRSVIDVQIHQNSKIHHDDKMKSFDFYPLALEFLKISLIIGGLVEIFVLITLKLNVFFAFGISVLVAGIGWQVHQWHNGGGHDLVAKYENVLIRIGGYNIVTLIFLFVAFIFVTIGLVLLP